MLLLLRGHVRDAFQNPALLSCLHQCVAEIPELRIMIHTWNVVSSSLSWRRVEHNPTPVTESWLLAQFPPIVRAKIVQCCIDQDTDIALHGATTGYVCRSHMPLLGWKRYIAGMWRASEQIHHDQINVPICSMRFDVFTNSNSMHIDDVKSFMLTHRHYYEDYCTFARPHLGLDNLFVSTWSPLVSILNTLHWQLDTVMARYPTIVNQELLVKYVNDEYKASKENQSKSI